MIDTLAPPGNPPPPLPVGYTLAVSQLQAHSATGAAARAPVRRVGRARFRTAAPAAVQFAEPSWAIVPIDAAPAATVDPGVRTWSEHLAALHPSTAAAPSTSSSPHPPAPRPILMPAPIPALITFFAGALTVNGSPTPCTGRFEGAVWATPDRAGAPRGGSSSSTVTRSND